MNAPVTGKRSFLAELKRRNVIRAAVLYIGAVWAFGQGFSQFSPALGLPGWATRAFLIAAAVGFPFWLVFAWVFEVTSQGIKRESEIAPEDSVTRRTGRRLDFTIIAVLAVAVVLLLGNQLVWHRGIAQVSAAPGPAIPAKSIAVLPFQNLSNDKNNAYFVAGMQGMILTKLGDIASLKVISRTSTEHYASHPQDTRSIGQQLGVATLLEGSVQKAGNEVLIEVQLVRAGSGHQIWAQTYQRTLSNVFGVEGEVSAAIAKALDARLSGAEAAHLAAVPTTNQAAYDLFLRAQYLSRKATAAVDVADYAAALPLYRQAIRHDPDFALAYARASIVGSRLAWWGGDGMDVKQLNQQARADAEQALKLAPNAPASYLAIGYSDYYGRQNFAGALKVFATALALQPNNADTLAARGYIERRLGRFEASVASLKQAFALNPRDSQLAFAVGRSYACLSRYSDAMQWFRRATAINPSNFIGQVAYAHAIVLRTGNITHALQAAQGTAPPLVAQRAQWLQLQRHYAAALTLTDQLPSNFFAITYLGSKTLARANLYRLMGNAATARPLFRQAVKIARANVGKQQGFTLPYAWLGLANAELGLGQVTQGLHAVSRALAIVMQQGDQESTPTAMKIGATLYAEARRPDLAIPLLAKALASPGIGVTYSPVLLWLDPAWDPIRHDPGFQALLKKYAKYKPAITYDTAPAAAPSTSAD